MKKITLLVAFVIFILADVHAQVNTDSDVWMLTYFRSDIHWVEGHVNSTLSN